MKDFKGNLGNYKILKTEDDSETVWSEYFDEACHNLSGAYEETIHNYILGCGIPELLDQENDISILDVGFGVGVGLKAFIDQLRPKEKSNAILSYYSIELDETFLLWSLKTTLPMLSLKRFEEETLGDKLIYYQGTWQETLTIKIFVGDGRQTLPLAFKLNLLTPLNVIFQDAFSPRKNPTLWSVEWFLFLKNISSTSVRLSTYSSSVSIRKSLMAAHWTISEASGFAHKKFMTIAKLTGETSEELIMRMARSPSLEIRDK